MKRKKAHSSQRADVAEMLRRVRDFRPAEGSFNYADRGRAVTESHQLYNESVQLTKVFPMDPDLSEACTEAHRLWYAAIERAYLPGFGEDVARLQAGSAAGMEGAVSFLEADPIFYRTGYIKEKLIRYIKRSMLTPGHSARLQAVVLSVVDRRDGREFRAYCRLACKVDSPEFREQLNQRLTRAWPSARSLTEDLPALMLAAQKDRAVRRRARWVLEALGQNQPKEKRP